MLEQLCEAIDQGEIGERAPGGAAMIEDGDGIDIVAAQDIGEAGAGQALHFGEAVEDRDGRSRERRRYVLADLANAAEDARGSGRP